MFLQRQRTLPSLYLFSKLSVVIEITSAFRDWPKELTLPNFPQKRENLKANEHRYPNLEKKESVPSQSMHYRNIQYWISPPAMFMTAGRLKTSIRRSRANSALQKRIPSTVLLTKKTKLSNVRKHLVKLGPQSVTIVPSVLEVRSVANFLLFFSSSFLLRSPKTVLRSSVPRWAPNHSWGSLLNWYDATHFPTHS